MTKKLIYGFLIFTLGLFMVACGESESAESSYVANVTPELPLNALGQPTCTSGTCNYTGTFQVIDGSKVALLGHTQIFEQPSSNQGLDLTRFFTHTSSFIGEVIEEVCPEQTGGLVYDSETGWSIQLGCRGSSNSDTPLLAAPVSGDQHLMYMQFAGTSISGRIQIVGNGTTQAIGIAAIDNGQGLYIDSINNIALRPIVQDNVIKVFEVGLYTNNQFQTAGVFTITAATL